jgi:hypothetical protein
MSTPISLVTRATVNNKYIYKKKLKTYNIYIYIKGASYPLGEGVEVARGEGGRVPPQRWLAVKRGHPMARGGTQATEKVAGVHDNLQSDLGVARMPPHIFLLFFKKIIIIIINFLSF